VDNLEAVMRRLHRLSDGFGNGGHGIAPEDAAVGLEPQQAGIGEDGQGFGMGQDLYPPSGLQSSVSPDVILVAVGVNYAVNAQILDNGQEFVLSMGATRVNEQAIHPVGCGKVKWPAQ
jgi:hypothetical protein